MPSRAPFMRPQMGYPYPLASDMYVRRIRSSRLAHARRAVLCALCFAHCALRTVLCALCFAASSVHAYAYACSACSVRTLTLAWLSKAVLETPREQSVHTKTGMVLSRRGWWSRTHL